MLMSAKMSACIAAGVRGTGKTTCAKIFAKAVNCLVADGCIIEGTVENSVLFRGVRVGKGAVVRNCILMQGVEVQDGAQLSNVISDKDAFIKRDRRIVGQESYPVVIEKNAVI